MLRILTSLTTLVVLAGRLLLGSGEHPPARYQAPEIKRYTDADVYKVYSVVAPLIARKTLSSMPKRFAILRSTIPPQSSPWACFPDNYEADFGNAYDDFIEANKQKRLLVPALRFQIPYDFVTQEQLDQMEATIKVPQDPAAPYTSGLVTSKVFVWERFYRRYPKSHGYIAFSAVGFSRDKTKAVASVSIVCGLLCAGNSYYLLSKHKGRWRVVTVSSICGGVS